MTMTDTSAPPERPGPTEELQALNDVLDFIEKATDYDLVVIATLARCVIDERNEAEETGDPALPYGGTWNPWTELRRRFDSVVLEWCDLPEGMNGLWAGRPSGGVSVITLDPNLRISQSTATLTHELIHDERRIGWHGAGTREEAETMADEEAFVNAETARRMEFFVPQARHGGC